MVACHGTATGRRLQGNTMRDLKLFLLGVLVDSLEWRRLNSAARRVIVAPAATDCSLRIVCVKRAVDRGSTWQG